MSLMSLLLSFCPGTFLGSARHVEATPSPLNPSHQRYNIISSITSHHHIIESSLTQHIHLSSHKTKHSINKTKPRSMASTGPPPAPSTTNNSEPTMNFPSRFDYDVQIGAVFILQCLAAFFTFSTVTSSFYFTYTTIIDFGGATAPEKQVVYYSLYPACNTNTVFSDKVQRAQRGVCASVYFAEIFVLAVILVNFAAIMLYVISSFRNTVVSLWR